MKPLALILGVVFVVVAVAQLVSMSLRLLSSLRYGNIYISETMLVQIGIMLVAGLIGIALLRSGAKDESKDEPAAARETER